MAAILKIMTYFWQHPLIYLALFIKIMSGTFVDKPWKCHVFVQQITLGSVRDLTIKAESMVVCSLFSLHNYCIAGSALFELDLVCLYNWISCEWASVLDIWYSISSRPGSIYISHGFPSSIWAAHWKNEVLITRHSFCLFPLCNIPV